jgi:hypothetical protein
MQITGGSTISKMGLFLGVETPKVNALFVVPNRRLPASFSSRNPRQISHALQTVRVVCFAVCSVLAVGCFSKIYKSIVRFIAIYVVNLMRWHRTCDIKPSEPVRRIMFPLDLKVDVSLVMPVPCLLPHPNFGARSVPIETSIGRVVSENLKKLGVFNHSCVLPELKSDYKRIKRGKTWPKK